MRCFTFRHSIRLSIREQSQFTSCLTQASPSYFAILQLCSAAHTVSRGHTRFPGHCITFQHLSADRVPVSCSAASFGLAAYLSLTMDVRLDSTVLGLPIALAFLTLFYCVWRSSQWSSLQEAGPAHFWVIFFAHRHRYGHGGRVYEGNEVKDQGLILSYIYRHAITIYR